MPKPFVLFESYGRNPTGRSFHFTAPAEEISATALDQVIPALRRIDAAVQNGLHAAGFIAYEAAPAFDSHLRVKTPLLFPCSGLVYLKNDTKFKPANFMVTANFL